MNDPKPAEKRPKNLIGSRVKAARFGHKPPLGQADLAAALQAEIGVFVGQATISRLETGTRPVTDIELVALAKCLAVTPQWLLEGEAPHVASGPRAAEAEAAYRKLDD